MPQLPRLKSVASLALILSSGLLLNGCASTAEGITRALLDNSADKHPRQCHVTGPAFGGIDDVGDTGEAGTVEPKTLRAILVHGIGTHEVGWSTALQQRLSAMLGLNSFDTEVKNIQLISSKFPGEPLGRLLVTRSYDRETGNQLISYEVTWSEITEPMKKKLAYDTSSYYRDKRAEFNHNMKTFLNDRLLDPIAYLGSANAKIKASASEALCFTLMGNWRGLPASGEAECNLDASIDMSDIDNNQLIFITHSLGSRIVTDALQTEIAEVREKVNSADAQTKEKAVLGEILDAIQQKHVAFYMMANQLPLIDAALPPPRIVNQLPEYCEPDGEFYDQRIFAGLRVVAFSDPNDTLSYGLPYDYANTSMDSRLCPRLTNVIVNTTDVISPLGIIEMAAPLESHSGYQQDSIVLQVMADGIGTSAMTEEVAEKCEWVNIE